MIGLMLATGLVAPAQAKLKALVVGVSEYRDTRLAKSALPGAAGDARNMVSALVARGAAPADVDILVGAGATAAAITAALDHLAHSAEAGDRIVVYLSGHGAQVPAKPGDAGEPDGLDELFLGADASAWDPRRKRLPGAVRDDDFGLRIDAMRARGASVWFIVDACNGGGMQRAGTAGARSRSLDAKLLDIPSGYRGGRVDMSGLADARPVPGGGKVVAFYAAAPGSVAWERSLPTPAGPTPQGLFTWSLLRALDRSRPGGDFISLAGGMETARMSLGPPSTAPLIGGDLSERILFDGASRDLLAFARQAPPLASETRLAIGRSDAGCAGPEPDPALLRTVTAPVPLSGCRRILVELHSTGAGVGVRPWYRQADGSYIALADGNGVRLPAGGVARFGFTFTDRDPQSGAPMAHGPEYLIVLAEDGGGAVVIPFSAGP
jgi:hypothetical protein